MKEAGVDEAVVDTQVVLDLFVFADEASRPLLQALRRGRVHWVATPAMRDELARVLAYPQIVRRLERCGLEAAGVLSQFDRHARLVDAPAAAPMRCSDPDDQIFIDLAVARQALLVSKDGAVLAMRQRLAACSVRAQPVLDV